MLIYARPGHASVFEGAAHVVISIRPDSTYDYTIYVGDAFRAAGMHCLPDGPNFEALTAAVKALALQAIDAVAVANAKATYDGLLSDGVNVRINGAVGDCTNSQIAVANRRAPKSRKRGG